ncbi:MAG TPA: histidine kinase, partial [Chitinophagaceae bacterium]|nr:histidine kinase [Chitinophagaceae bacterium]
SIFLSTVMVYIFSIAFRYVLDFFTIRQQQETLKKQHAEAQLNLLKAQVQPHFLFNTLNNIYYTAQEESPLTAELIERLSSIMRYFLEEGPRKYIFLNTELDFIKNYIALEKIRMRFPLKVSENVVNVDTGTVKIPPMLLIPLVENVFKHGINKREKDNFITLDITRRQKLSFKVSNKVQDDIANTQHGTGLANLKNRLNILYGLNYLLTEVKGNGIYSVELIIPV